MNRKLILCLILLTISHSLLAQELDGPGFRTEWMQKSLDEDAAREQRSREEYDKQLRRQRDASIQQEKEREEIQKSTDERFKQIEKKNELEIQAKEKGKGKEKLKTAYDLAKKKIANLTSELVAAKEEIVVLKASLGSASNCSSGADSADKEKLNIVSCQSLTTQDLLISCNSECFETTSETSTSSESLGDLKCTVSDSKAICGKNHRVYQRVSEPAYLRMCNILAKQVHDAKRGLKKERIDIPDADVKINKASAAARQH